MLYNLLYYSALLPPPLWANSLVCGYKTKEMSSLVKRLKMKTIGGRMEKWTRSEEEKTAYIYIIRCNELENGLNVSHRLMI